MINEDYLESKSCIESLNMNLKLMEFKYFLFLQLTCLAYSRKYLNASTVLSLHLLIIVQKYMMQFKSKWNIPLFFLTVKGYEAVIESSG